MSRRCVPCGRPHPGPVPADSLVAIRAAKPRPSIAGGEEAQCLVCFWWAAEVARIVQRGGLASIRAAVDPQPAAEAACH